MNDIAIVTPGKRVSAWVAETDPKYAQAWLASLPLADSGESAREIYQALYTLNRQDIEPGQRLELMELYVAPVATVVNGLQGGLARAGFPLSPRRRQVADFVRQLYMEMAAGYKCTLKDLVKARFHWGRRQHYSHVSQRAMAFLGELLLRAYQVYLPAPAGVWKDIHELYRFGETGEWLDAPIEPLPGEGTSPVTMRDTYVRILMMALARPYQMPQGECLLVQRFLGKWAGKARITGDLRVANPSACFLVDLGADGPPLSLPREAPAEGGSRRLLNALELVRHTHGFVSRLNKGEPARPAEVGFEALDMTVHDVLQRLTRAWGLAARRQHSRLKRKGNVSLCAGLGAIHFFMNDQKPFALEADDEDRTVTLPVGGPAVSAGDDGEADGEAMDIALDQPLPDSSGKKPAALPAPSELYRVDRWQIRDVSPRGLLLVGEGGTPVHVRVGELLGVQRADQIGTWSIAVARRLSNPAPGSVEMGIEFLAPRATPVAVSRSGPRQGRSPALLLPAVVSLKRPASLLVERGLLAADEDVDLSEEGRPRQRVRILKRLERTNGYEQWLFAQLLDDQDARRS